MTERLRLLLLLLCLASAACKKEDKEQCDNLPLLQGPSFGWSYKSNTPFINRAFFNPADDNEFLYVTANNGVSKLCIYNLTNKVSKQIYEGEIWYPPTWGRNGWIVMNLRDAIWRIKSNGDSLKLVSNSASYHHASLNFDGTAIFTMPVDREPVMMDLNGDVIDTLKGVAIAGCTASFDNDKYICRGEMVGIYSISKRTFQNISPYDIGTAFVGGPINDDEFIWSDKTGIYRSNRRTENTTRIKAACETREYFYPSVNKSKTKCLFTRLIQVADLNTSIIDLSYKIVMIDVDGQNEQEIEIKMP